MKLTGLVPAGMMTGGRFRPGATNGQLIDGQEEEEEKKKEEHKESIS